MIWGEGFDKYKPISTPAADFIIEQLNEHPGEVIVFTIGPVPNIGDVIKKDPKAWRKVKAVYSMFGSFYHGYGSSPVPAAEYNVRADVESAQLMINSGVPLTLAGLDVTAMVVLKEERRLKLLFRQSPLTDSLCGLYTLWGNRDPVLFDPVAVAMLVEPSLVSSRRAHVRVTDEGYTVIDESKPPNATIGMHIQTEPFLDLLLDHLLKQNLMR
jgi:inosine-uridine nucleoside N-ribohydrolase